MVEARSVQWVELHGPELVGATVESAIETLRGAGFTVMVSEYPRPAEFPPPSGDRVHVCVDRSRFVTGVEAA